MLDRFLLERYGHLFIGLYTGCGKIPDTVSEAARVANNLLVKEQRVAWETYRKDYENSQYMSYDLYDPAYIVLGQRLKEAEDNHNLTIWDAIISYG